MENKLFHILCSHCTVKQFRNFSNSANTPIIPLQEAKRFMSQCMETAGTPKPHAEAIAYNLIEADYRGHFSHGMNRLELYINEIITKVCNGAAVPKILKETPATAWVDGNNGLGVVVGNFSMQIAIKKAKAVGVGWVCSKRKIWQSYLNHIHTKNAKIGNFKSYCSYLINTYSGLISMQAHSFNDCNSNYFEYSFDHVKIP